MRLKHFPLSPPKQLGNGVTLTETVTTYQDERHRCAVLVFAGKPITLTLGDTLRCATDLEAAKRTLRNLAEQAGITPRVLANCADELQAHCQLLTKRS